MRVIFLTITFYPEPNAIHGLPLAKALAARGFDIKVLTAFPQYPMGRIYPGYRMRPWQRETVDGISILRVPIYPSHDTSAIRRILTYLSFAFFASTIGVALIGSADLVYLYDPPPTNGLASLILKLFRGTPIVHDIADMWPETVIESGMVRGERTKKIVSSILGAWCRFLYRQADVVTVLSDGFKRLLIERGVPADKVKVVYNWADETTFHPLEPDPELARELGFEGRFNIVYAGNLGVYQALDTVIKAAALVKDHPKIQVVIVGMGPKQDELKRLAAELKVDNVLFLGGRPYAEMPKINNLADVLLIHLKDIAFLHATVPGKTQVSLATGRPVLMAVRGDAAEIVRQAGAGVICEPENPEDMARAMVELFQLSKDELEEMGARGRSYYLNNLSLDSAGKQIDEIFRAAAAQQEPANSVGPGLPSEVSPK
ncbi:MAG TPA: glycosyltransferase WbuB [Blastocatellia bacterium]|nr:glycosyltransferase WbuB [Blastocatellia bacterium]